jgi:ATP-dependent Clp protease ATP-binding subunit ClpA
VSRLLQEVERHKEDAIIFIDEAHNLIASDAPGQQPRRRRDAQGADGARRAAHHHGDHPDEAEELDSDPAFRRRLIGQHVAPASVGDTVKILRGLRKHKLRGTGVELSDEALETAARLGARVPERYLPDDRHRSGRRRHRRRRLSGKRAVSVRLIEKRFHKATGIRPDVAAGGAQAARLETLGDRLKQRVVGQDHAIDSLAAAAGGRRRHRDPDQPLGAFVFAGPTGVGKTELAKALAAEHFGSRKGAPPARHERVPRMARPTASSAT